MTYPMILSLQGKQCYPDQEPEIIELFTEGILEQQDEGWKIRYEESDLTGLDGVTTSFYIRSGCVTLERTGKLRSQMVFQEGQKHDSLYQMEFGALLISVCATKVAFDLSPAGGNVDLVYQIEIEQNIAGTVEYHLSLQPK